MKAMLTDENQRLCWREVDDPVVGREDVLIRVAAAGVNRADLLQRVGKYPSPAGCPPWMGLEVAGVVEALGDDARAKGRFQIGDRVCALLGGGGYAEYVAVAEGMVMPMPRGLSFAEAAALPEAYATSYLNLFIEGHLQAGQTVYIPGGTSGLASAAIPLAKAFGARVITTVRKDAAREQLTRWGADVILNSVTDDLPAFFAAEEAAGRAPHVAMDCLGGEALGACLPYMARGGYWIVISTLAGIETTVALRPLLKKHLHLVGSTLRVRPPKEKAEILQSLVRDVWQKIEAGELTPAVDRILPIAQAEDAHALLEHGNRVGKVVLEVDPIP